MGGEHVKDSLFCKNVLPCLVFGGLVWFCFLVWGGLFVCLFVVIVVFVCFLMVLLRSAFINQLIFNK